MQEYLQFDRRHERIKNFNDFVKEFLKYSLKSAYYFPITKTGYILSTHCSPFVSGFMLEIERERHGVRFNKTVLEKYFNDPNFTFFLNTSRKYGFMVDKNAPWRIVFNVASGVLNPANTAGQKYMSDYGVSYDNIFSTYFRKAHLDELENLRGFFLSFYESFYRQFSSYETIKYYESPGPAGYFDMKIRNERKQREPPPFARLLRGSSAVEHQGAPVYSYTSAGERRIIGTAHDGVKELTDEYWLKVLLKLRMEETNFPHDSQNFRFFMNEAIRANRDINLESSLNYINDLTKGFFVSKFIRKGRYWYGDNPRIYNHRKIRALEEGKNPALISAELYGNKD